MTTLADMDAPRKGVLGSVIERARQDGRDVSPASLPANYELKTKLLDNNSQMLVALIEGMRPMNETYWKRLAETLEVRQGLRSAFIEWKAEGERLKSIAPLDFLEAIEELTEDQRPQLPSAHRQSA